MTNAASCLRKSTADRLDRRLRPAAVRRDQAGAFPPGLRPGAGRAPRRDRRHRRQPGGAELRQHHRGAGAERARPRPRLQRVLRAGRRRHRRRHRGGRARDLAAARPPQQRALSRPRALCPHRRRSTAGATRSASTPSRPACSTATTPASCAPAPRSTSRRRTASPRSTSGWRASAPSSGRTCWRTRRPTRWCWRRAISPACPISPAPPRARRRRSAGTPGKYAITWRARRARPSCNSPRAAICARRSSRPGSSAARTAGRPTTAR